MFDIFLIVAQNIDSGCTLEPTRRKPQFSYIKVWKGVYIKWTCFPDVRRKILLDLVCLKTIVIKQKKNSRLPRKADTIHAAVQLAYVNPSV